LEQQAKALRNFRLNAEQAAKRGLHDGLIKSLQQAGAEGALRMKQLANAMGSGIARANRAWQSGQREVDRYVDATVKVPRQLATHLRVEGVAQAISSATAVESALNNIRDETVNVYVNRIGGVTSSYGRRSVEPGMAGGGTVTGAPRLPYGDKVWRKLAPARKSPPTTADKPTGTDRCSRPSRQAAWLVVARSWCEGTACTTDLDRNAGPVDGAGAGRPPWR
jgi:hypothetical protein